MGIDARTTSAVVRVGIVWFDGGRLSNRSIRRPAWPQSRSGSVGRLLRCDEPDLRLEFRYSDTYWPTFPYWPRARRCDAKCNHPDLRILSGRSPLVPSHSDVLRLHHRLRARWDRRFADRRRLWLAFGANRRWRSAASACTGAFLYFTRVGTLPRYEGQ